MDHNQSNWNGKNDTMLIGYQAYGKAFNKQSPYYML